MSSTIAIPDVSPTYGIAYVGVLFATFFQGLLTMQAYTYYESFPNDSWKLKSYVAIVWLVDLVHLIFIGQAVYHYLVASWGHPEALQGTIIWTFNAHLIPLAVATFMCQGFFLWRIWVLCKGNIVLVSFLAILCLATLGLYLFGAIADIRAGTAAEFRETAPEVTALFSIDAATDLLIALILCYYLRRKSSPFEKTNSLVSRLVRYTVTTGLVTSILAIACLVTYFASPNTFLFVALHFSLGRMYTNCFVAALNSRRWFRTSPSQNTTFSGAKAFVDSKPPQAQSGVSIHIETIYDRTTDDRNRTSEDLELKPVKQMEDV